MRSRSDCPEPSFPRERACRTIYSSRPFEADRFDFADKVALAATIRLGRGSPRYSPCCCLGSSDCCCPGSVDGSGRSSGRDECPGSFISLDIGRPPLPVSMEDDRILLESIFLVSILHSSLSFSASTLCSPRFRINAG
jgi:hypothetical protein